MLSRNTDSTAGRLLGVFARSSPCEKRHQTLEYIYYTRLLSSSASLISD